MLRGTGGQGEYPNSRRYSTNNPFRMSMIDAGGISPSSEQPQQDWLRPSSPSIGESHEMQYVHAPYHSAGSLRVNSPLGDGFRYVLFYSILCLSLLWGKREVFGTREYHMCDIRRVKSNPYGMM